MKEKWQQDLDVYRNIHSTFIFEGNINDKQASYLTEDYCQPVELSNYLNSFFLDLGYQNIIFYNIVDKFHNAYDSNLIDNDLISLKDKKCDITSNNDSIDLRDVAASVREIMCNEKKASVVIMEMANTFTGEPDRLISSERIFYSQLMFATKESVLADSLKGGQLPNLLILVVEKSNDVPAWFYLNNPYVKILTIPKPVKEIRKSIIETRIQSLYKFSEVYGLKESEFEEERKKTVDLFTDLTNDMTLVDIEGVLELFRQMEFHSRNVKSAIKLFKYGKVESEWDKVDFSRMSEIRNKVRGQDAAVEKAIEVIAKACAGLTDFDSDDFGRPRGVLFLAGPTGTGKTKLAKAISEMVFGDENFVIRFDMSEYSQAHSDQKLIGAPPGYVGYNAGGQLTNAVKNKPFCILLFDEIDKADSSILDKFLQILDDGRLTDSSGETVYFSETFIIFTSNLGIIETSSDGTKMELVDCTMSYQEISQKVTESIRRHFKFGMRNPRPELLSRIGNNFVVFDFIRNGAAKEILMLELNHAKEHLMKTKGIELHLSSDVEKYLLVNACEKETLENGGRGIRNLVESSLASKIGKIILEEHIQDNQKLYIEDIASNPPKYSIN